jgi:diguanylate cyclase (GGDEF)-like protein
VASVALLPIRRHGRLFGSYNLGSSSPARFPRNAASDFLHHLAAVIAACLEIGVTRDRLRHLGLADALTGVNNRRFFDQRLPEEIARACRGGFPLSCLFIDVDYFKNFNDRYGHQAGDHALRGVAELVRSLLRRSDILARYGGEEFAALLPETGQDAAAVISERVRSRIESARFAVAGGLNAAVTVSIGVATLDRDMSDPESAGLGVRLVQAADRGVYRAKTGGRNRVVIQPLG